MVFGGLIYEEGGGMGVVECLVSDWRGGGDMDLEIREVMVG